MKRNVQIALSVFGIAALLSGCASVKNMKIPDFDFINIPEFREEAEHIGDYPSVVDAPETPKDVRSDAQWDAVAQQLLKQRNGFVVPVDGAPILSDAEIETEMQVLRSRVDEYKLDDPQ